MTKNNAIDPAAVGVEVSWSFGDGAADSVKIPRVDVAAALIDNGFDADRYFPAKDPSVALKHAVRIVPKGRAIIVKELERKRRDTPLAFGVYQKDTREGEGGDEWICGARVRVENTGVACYEPEGAYGIKACMDAGQRIADDANELLDIAFNKDLSETLLDIGWGLNWVSRRRNKGGVYLVLSDGKRRAERAERFVGLLHDLAGLTSTRRRSQRFQAQISEVYPKPLSNATWAEAASDNFEDKIERLLKDLDGMKADGKMRAGTMEKRADECDDLIKRAEEYRQFLADKVDDLGTRLASIRDQFQAAISEAAAGAKSEFDRIEELASEPEAKAPTFLGPKAKDEEPKGKPAGRKVVPFDEAIFDV